MVCGGTGCTSSGSEKVINKFNEEIKAHSLENEVTVVRTGCFGLCELGPIVIVYPEGSFYIKISEKDVPEIVSEHLLKGRPVKHLLHKETVEGETIKAYTDVSFYKKQMRVALRNCGLINPEEIKEYIAMDGYQALAKVLTQMTPQQLIDEIKRSGIRGRGGAGFPTGTKWEITSNYKDEQKYVICNADEGDPGAFMDRSILEGDPHSVIEAMIIAGYAVGAKNGFVYIRAEYPIAVKRIQSAIVAAREYGLLGKEILGSKHDFDIEVRLGAGAFVCGEETALMSSIMGNRGEPFLKPPFPAERGLWGHSTLINNVETLANIPVIVNKGADWFAGIGTEKSKGTKVFALGGKINHTGLIEVPAGTTLREIVYDIGGGIPEGREFKAAQTGGPSGGCLPAELLDISIEYDTLLKAGSMMGSGGLIIMDDTTCMVDIARFFLEFTVDESCGKCTACRIGTKRLLEILTKISEGYGTEQDIELLEQLCKLIKVSSLCGLGQTAPNPVLSTLRYFRDEYMAHVNEKRCPAGVCKSLLSYEIIPAKCKACGICAKNCPVSCISGERKVTPYVIDKDICVRCGVCMAKCPFDAITR